MENVAQVLIDGASSDLTFSYLVPVEMVAQPGIRVTVPLRGRQAVGTVTSVDLTDISELSYQLRPITKVVSDEPFLTPGLMQLARWMSEYYLSPVETAYRTMLPKPSRGEKEKQKLAKFAKLGSVTPANGDLEQLSRKAKKQFEVYEAISKNGEQLLSSLCGEQGFGRASIKALENREWLEVMKKLSPVILWVKSNISNRSRSP